MKSVNLKLLDTEISKVKTIAIVSNNKNLYMIPEVYDYIYKKNHNIVTSILEPTDIACRLKLKKFDLYVLLTIECPFHSFVDSITFGNTGKNLEVYRNPEYIFDSQYSDLNSTLKNIPENKYVQNLSDKSSESIIITDCQQFYDYFFYISDSVTLPKKSSLLKKDRLRFLIKRLSLIDQIKEKQTFGIFFSSIEYQELAERVSKFLESNKKETLLIFLKDISWERLVAIEFIEVIVIIDCPFHSHFDINIHVPLVTPFEVAQSFKEKWNGEYDINEFNVENLSADQDIFVEKSSHTEISLKKETHNLEYYVDDIDDTNIYRGLKGFPESYEH